MIKNQYIEKILDKIKDIDSVLDIQCGLIDKDITTDIFYIGIDVIKEKILINRKNFKKDKNKIFMILDSINESLPYSDLVFCIDVAEYLSYDLIWPLLENIRNRKCKYLAFSHYHCNAFKSIRSKSMKNINPVNLSDSPFYFPDPIFSIPGEIIEQSIDVYRIQDIEFYMDWRPDNICKLRSELMKYLCVEFDKIYSVLSTFKNGISLFQKAITNGIDWYKYYDNLEYKEAINDKIYNNYKNIILLTHGESFETIIKDMEDSYGQLLNRNNFSSASTIALDYMLYRIKISDLSYDWK